METTTTTLGGGGGGRAGGFSDPPSPLSPPLSPASAAAAALANARWTPTKEQIAVLEGCTGRAAHADRRADTADHGEAPGARPH